MKKITLPLPTLAIFEELAKSHLDTCGISQSDKTYSDRVDACVYDLAIDAYNHSFTPSGEIGNNPRTPKIADSFFHEFDDILGDKGFFKTKLVDASDKMIATKERQFKSILVSLSQLYLETQARLKTKGRQLNDQGYDSSSFEYKPNAVKGKPDETEMKDMVRVETNRYIRMFMATYFIHVVHDAMRTNSDSVVKIINSLGLIQTPEADLDGSGVLRHLRSPKTRSQFVKMLRDHLSEFKIKTLE